MIPADKIKGDTIQKKVNLAKKKQSNIYPWTGFCMIKKCAIFLFYFNVVTTFRPRSDQHPISFNNINAVKPW